MKSIFIIFFLSVSCIFFSFFIQKKKQGDFVYIEASKQRSGNADAGYIYLTEGNYLKSGIPLQFFKMAIGKSFDDLGREGLNENIPYSFNVVVAPNGEKIASPNCLQCHAQEFDGKVAIGMGNSLSDYTTNHSSTAIFVEQFLKSGAGKAAMYD
ncbi:MAG: hypothetical protein ACRDE8_18340, partial [Ginsengibacter sp.]